MLTVISLRQRRHRCCITLPGAGINPTGANAVYADVWPKADSQCVGERDNAAFAGGISFRVRFGLQRAGGGHVYDGALGFPKIRNRVFGYQKGACQVYVEPALPLLQAERFYWP